MGLLKGILASIWLSSYPMMVCGTYFCISVLERESRPQLLFGIPRRYAKSADTVMANTCTFYQVHILPMLLVLAAPMKRPLEV